MTANEPEVVGPLPTFYVEELVKVQMQDVEVEGSQISVLCPHVERLWHDLFSVITPSLVDSSDSMIPHLIVNIRSPFFLILFVCCCVTVLIVAQHFSFCIFLFVPWPCRFNLKHNQYRFVRY